MRIFNWKNLAQLGSRAEVLTAMKVAIDLHFKRPMIERGDIVLPDDEVQALKALGVKLTVPDNTPNTGNRQIVVADMFKPAPLQDFGFMEVFDLVDMRGVPKDSFEILDATNGITFNQRIPGEDAKIYKVTDSKASVSFLEFAAGLGFLDVWFQFQEYYKFDDIVNQTQNKYYDKMASLHYALFTALGAGVNQAFDASDAQTIDNACAQIIDDCKAKGYFVNENVQFVVLANPKLLRRLTKAIWPLSVNPNDTSSQGPTHNIRRIVPTWHLANTSYYVVLPGGKLKRGMWMDLSVESKRDALKSAEDFIWKGQYNGAIGDSQQVRRCSLA